MKLAGGRKLRLPRGAKESITRSPELLVKSPTSREGDPVASQRQSSANAQRANGRIPKKEDSSGQDKQVTQDKDTQRNRLMRMLKVPATIIIATRKV